MFQNEEKKIVYTFDSEIVWIEAWGSNALRVRAIKRRKMTEVPMALTQDVSKEAKLHIEEDGAWISNGKIQAHVTNKGKIIIYNDKGKILLEEYTRNRKDITEKKCSAIEVEAREFQSNLGGDYHLTCRFESQDAKEKIYGMGQYQQPYLDLKGMDIELAHRNSQASVPFAVSSSGYGFLWNNPAIGRAVFGKNIMSFEAYSTTQLDYWVVAGDKPAEILHSYANVTGKVPMMPEYGLGFWQCKLRYQTQDELLEVAREYKKREIPLDVIVADFFHWPKQGDWRFDLDYWPNPDAMIRELNDMGVELMVSIWPTVDRLSENYEEMLEKGYLIGVERGLRISFDFQGNSVHIDTTNPEARKYLWEKVKKNYYDKGVKLFWLDEAEPEYSVYDFDNYRYHLGSNLQIGNLYPLKYAQGFYEGMKSQGQDNIVNLLRCAWAGSQKYGALVWSGDIASSFNSFRNQLAAGLNMGMAGIPWWTTDIGGFHGGNPDDEDFRELFVRWFEWGTFCPVMRLHGDREPHKEPMGTTGGAFCVSGSDNEIWSYGEKVYDICRHYIDVRESMRDYIRSLMQEAHKEGSPIMRTMFYEFPEDENCWNIEDQYMFGSEFLVAPVLYEGARERAVYFPEGCTWREVNTGNLYKGGQSVIVEAPLERMPVFTPNKE